MKGLNHDALVALGPVREALHAAAQAEADEIEARAADEVDQILTGARTTVAEIIASAAAHGASVARTSAALRSARVRREANELVLAAQESQRRWLADEVVRAASELRSDPRYGAWIEQLTRRCREVLGTQATVTPSPTGGVIGELGSRRLDLSIPVLAAAVVDAHGAEVRQLWTP